MSGTIRPWWSGDPRVEPYMRIVSDTIKKYHEQPGAEYTDIYNRCYEAVYKAIKDTESTRNVRKTIPNKVE